MRDYLNPKVSLIIPLYNQERFIKKCLRSACEQTYKNLEIIVVNDGSTDKSRIIAQKYADNDFRVIIIDKKNEGVTWARRDGLNISTGEYIAFMDSDDMMPKRAIEILVRAINDYDVDVVIGGLVRKLAFFHQNKNDVFSFPINAVIKQPELFESFFVGFAGKSVFPVSMCAHLYKRTIIENALKETELFSSRISNMGEDQQFNFSLFPYIKSMIRIPDIVYHYRYGGMTAKYNPYITQMLDSSDVRLQKFDEYHYEKAYRPLYIEYVNMLYDCASHFLRYGVKNKVEIIEFFRNEYDNRQIMPRAIEYFKNHSAPNQKMVDLMINKDFEAMIDFANCRMKERTNKLSYKTKTVLDRFLKIFY